MMKLILRCVCLALLMLPTTGMAEEAVLLEENALLKKIEQNPEYQLIDARSPEMQQLAPIAFSTRYRLNVPITKTLVLVVADTDEEAAGIVKDIPAATGRAVFAVQGGFEIWQRVVAKASTVTSVSKSYVIPKNTCEQGKPIQELKRDKPLQQFQKK